MRSVFSSMGTAVSLEWEPAPRTGSVADNVEQAFAELDRDFSLFRPDSELSRIGRGELRLLDAGEPVHAVYAQALEWRSRTSGAFTPHRPDGVIDLSGIVKALAIDRAGAVMEAAGLVDWCVNAGGDILRGAVARRRSVGIVDPDDRTKLLCAVVLDGSRRAVATSGGSERGDHIWPREDATGVRYSQVTVVADDIVSADVLATAIVAGGPTTLAEAARRWSVDILTVSTTGNLSATPGFRTSLADHRSDPPRVGAAAGSSRRGSRGLLLPWRSTPTPPELSTPTSLTVPGSPAGSTG